LLLLTSTWGKRKLSGWLRYCSLGRLAWLILIVLFLLLGSVLEERCIFCIILWILGRTKRFSPAFFKQLTCVSLKDFLLINNNQLISFIIQYFLILR
jgi:hypothetical protein